MESSIRQRLLDNDISEITCSNEDEVKDAVDILLNQPNHSSLQCLHIAFRISIDRAISIANVLERNNSLIELSFCWGSICRDGVKAVVEALSNHNNTTVAKLVLRNATTDYTAIVAMGRMLKSSNSLTDLDIGDCYIDSDGARAIGDSLKQNTTLISLNLRHVILADVGVIAIADGIKENDLTSLTVLNLSSNSIGILGANAIATMLATNKSLIELNIGHNGMIGSRGVITIAEALRQNNSLCTLNLDYITFGDDGATSIASLLTINSSLKELRMECCAIDDDGVYAIMDTLMNNKSLEFISLNSNPFNAGAVIYFDIGPMLETNTTLKTLYLGDHSYDMDDFDVGSILKILEDYNDTVNILISDEDGADKVMLGKIRERGEENCKGIRRATIKALRIRRTIFNSLLVMWIH